MIIGRQKEKEILNRLYLSKTSEFVVVHGRRRIGKTYLVREFFSKKKCHFLHVTGVHDGSLVTQISKFMASVAKTFFNDAPLKIPSNWDEAFDFLNKQIEAAKGKVVIFIDELPWLVTRRSKLLSVIDYYWNHHWSQLKNIIFVVCGSSASWMIKNIIYNKGGLHNRVTSEIKLLPFSLAETKKFLQHKKIKFNNRHILSIYMALGGVPYYLNYLKDGYTAEQNIQHLIFDDNAPLKDEFKKLFASLFKDAKVYIEIIKLLSKTKKGLSRVELEAQTKYLKNGGRMTDKLNDLCSAGFVHKYIPWQKQRGEFYKVIDEFCLFYLYWMKGGVNKKFTRNYWLQQSSSPTYKAWAGYSFENTCFKHVEQIIKRLNIYTASTIDTWRFVPRSTQGEGAQIDLFIDRTDDAITIIEVKYTAKPFVINKSYAEQLEKKLKVFKAKTRTKKLLLIALVSTSGLKSNQYSDKLISNVVTLDALFENID